MVVPSSATPRLTIPGMEVIAIDVSDGVGKAEAATTLAEVEFVSLQTFVDNVIAWTQGGKIGLLHIQVHGNSQLMSFGDDQLSLDNFKEVYRGALSLLSPYLAAGATVHIRACEIGQNVALLQNLAAAWNVTIVAGTGLQDNLPILDVNWGRYVTILPNGTTDYAFFEPDAAKWQGPIARSLRMAP